MTCVGEEVYVFGGVSSAGGRTDSLTKLAFKGIEDGNGLVSANEQALAPPPPPLFAGRAWHSTAYSPATLNLVSYGGRTHPLDPRSDVIAYDVAGAEWRAPHQVGEGAARYRHSMTRVDAGPEGADDTYLIFGGTDGLVALSRPQIMVVSRQQGGDGDGPGHLQCTWIDAEFEGADPLPAAR